MNLKEVKEVLQNTDNLLCCINVDENSDLEITGISVDTRELKKGNLFICRKGQNFDSHALAGEIAKIGAAGLIVQKPVDIDNFPVFLVNDSRLAEAVISSHFYEFPDEKLKVYGVTGTNGKTTISTMLHYLLTRMDTKGTLIGTIQNIIVDRAYDSLNTTPTALEIIKSANETLKKDGKFISMEVSSHALSLKRVESIKFDYAVLTNITQDHLDFHNNMDNYASTKFHLFELLKTEGTAIINFDDPYAQKLVAQIPMNNHIISYGQAAEGKMLDYAASDIKISINGIKFNLLINGKFASEIQSPLIAEYNVYNILAVVALLNKEGYTLKEISKHLKEFRGVEGRFEMYSHVGNDIDLVIDFAHTPDALQKTLETAKKLTRNRVLVVFGAGGEADRSKRPIMGKIASELSDVMIITTDNPKSENPIDIIKQIESGVESDIPYLLIEDRKMAIETSINLASKGDMVILAGKGHEKTQIFNHTYLPFNDRDIAFQMIRALKQYAS